MTIKITYKNGRVLEQKVNYVYIEEDRVCFTVFKEVHSIFHEPVIIPRKNITGIKLDF